jgi:transposase
LRQRRSKLTDEQSLRLMEHFVAGTPARTAAQLVGVNRNTATLFYHKARELIAEHLAEESPFQDAVEVDENYLKPHGQGRNKPGSKLPVFALLKRGGKVYTAMVLDSRREAPLHRAKVRPDSIVYTDPPPARSSALHVSHFQHKRVQAREPEAAGKPIDSIENFWNQAKRHMRRYNGIPRRHFHLFLKECEWRFNYGSPRQLLTNLKHWITRRPH